MAIAGKIDGSCCPMGRQVIRAARELVRDLPQHAVSDGGGATIAKTAARVEIRAYVGRAAGDDWHSIARSAMALRMRIMMGG